MTHVLSQVFGTLGAVALDELAAAFRWFRLERGEPLFAQGDPGDALYVLVSGRLQVSVRTSAGESRVVGEIVPGEIVGEMALVSDDPRSATVVAVRGSLLQMCDRHDFELLVDAHPQLSRQLSAILVQRLNKANQRTQMTHRKLSVALVPLHDGLDRSDFIQPFLSALERSGNVLHLDRVKVLERVRDLNTETDTRLEDLRLLPWFEEQESRHDLVMYEADAEPSPWTLRCVSQADRIVVIADADRAPQVNDLEARIDSVLSGARPPVHLVLIHPTDRDRPRNTRAWLDPREIHRHHHVRRRRSGDVERVARLLTGRGLGLVLSGGGARGLAHIGVLRVLDELGISVDAIGGTSMGAGMAGQCAMGLTPTEMRDSNWRELCLKKLFGRYTLPMYSLVSRTGVDDSFREHWQDRDIADLWIPFFCTSCDLQKGEKVIHERGLAWKAIRASISIPGVLPPVVDGDRLLVDGGVLDNLPEREMREFCGGPVIAVDVSPGRPLAVDFEYDALPSPWSALWHRLSPFREAHRFPTLIDVLMRTATVSNAGQQGRAEDSVDLVLRPPVGEYGLLEFDALDRILATAEAYSRPALAEWLATRSQERTPSQPSTRLST
jgi:predicted acylesterase/phospholipase RssA/CRP-like cAMP-binding protein